jgi:hypothetical protein
MVFVGTSKRSISGNNTGAEPNYTGTYGQYDNGATVFSPLYDNFAGTSLSGLWETFGHSVIATVDNGVTSTSSSYGALVSVRSTFNPDDYAFDMYGYSITPSNRLGMGGWLNPSTTYPFQVSTLPEFSLTDWALYYPTYDMGVAADNNPHVFTVWSSTTNTIGFGLVDYAHKTSGSLRSGFAGTSTAQEEVIYTEGGTGFTQWSRIRYLPTGGNMPTITLGSVTPITPPYASNIMWL